MSFKPKIAQPAQPAEDVANKGASTTGGKATIASDREDLSVANKESKTPNREGPMAPNCEEALTKPVSPESEEATSFRTNPKFIYKIGSIIKLFHTFLETVNGNQFLSDCYYYYNVVTTSERKEECIQAKAVLKRMESLYETKGTLADEISFLDEQLKVIGAQRRSTEKGLSPSGFITKKSTSSNFSGPMELVNGIRILKSTMGTLVAVSKNLK